MKQTFSSLKMNKDFVTEKRWMNVAGEEWKLPNIDHNNFFAVRAKRAARHARNIPARRPSASKVLDKNFKRSIRNLPVNNKVRLARIFERAPKERGFVVTRENLLAKKNQGIIKKGLKHRGIFKNYLEQEKKDVLVKQYPRRDYDNLPTPPTILEQIVNRIHNLPPMLKAALELEYLFMKINGRRVLHFKLDSYKVEQMEDGVWGKDGGRYNTSDTELIELNEENTIGLDPEKDITFEVYDKKGFEQALKERNKRQKLRGGFCNWKAAGLKENIDEFQLQGEFGRNDHRFNENCLFYTLKSYFWEDVQLRKKITILESGMKLVKKDDLKKIAFALNIIIRLTNGGAAKRTKQIYHPYTGNSKTVANLLERSDLPSIDICYSHDHFYLNKNWPDFVNGNGQTTTELNSIAYFTSLYETRIEKTHEELIEFAELNKKRKAVDYGVQDIVDEFECSKVAAKKVEKINKELIFCFDTETTTDIESIHKIFQICVKQVNGDYIDSQTSATCVIKMFQNLSKYIKETYPENVKDDVILYAHNAKYDFAQILEYVGGVRELIEKEGSFFQVKFTHGKINYVVRDTYKLVADKLENLPEFYGEKPSKIAYPYSVNKIDNLRRRYIPWSELTKSEQKTKMTEIKQNCIKMKLKIADGFDWKRYSEIYCREDVNIICKMLRVFDTVCEENFKFSVYSQLTISSMADKYMMDQGVYDGVYKLSGHVLKFIQNCVVGGRTMTS